MNNKEPLVSICIPTYGRVEILHKTLDSIFIQDVNTDLFEVCISDNSPTNETKEMLTSYFSDKKNICYIKSTCKGYFNSIEALKLGKGKYLKLHNNYTKFKLGYFKKFVSVLSEFEKDRPVIFFSFGTVEQKSGREIYDSFDAFLNLISYYSTWSTLFGIWKNDFEKIMKNNIELDQMFPHTSLLFSLCDNKKYVIDNTLYFENQDVGKRGGYNIPETFGTRYLGICKELLDSSKITEITYKKIKDGILHFIADWYVNVKYFGDKYTFGFENWEKDISTLYGECGVKYIIKKAKKRRLKCLIKRIIKRY